LKDELVNMEQLMKDKLAKMEKDFMKKLQDKDAQRE
jgi:hypothetical protein